ncbi:tetratricopeptide repeat protein [Rhodovarius crocodyli]|uniref:Tetratricopeptide repeat protein n=1 Tax=Rhodovarius crocodyli TaxID=1979269 RepID=A0A437MGH2_9PROT|nr:tetratricopeptide repeat protein [Rhodovarius crocodyli]RVT96712.1 tetratricopeptide repeat protein [Rhodovarius crocodyli]
MRAALSLLLLGLAGPALAQPRVSPAPPPPAAQPANPAQELDRAFAALRTAPDAEGAALVERRLLQLLAARATPAVTLLLARGQRNMIARQADDALEDFDAALTLAPELPDAWLARAQANHAAGDSQAAVNDLQQALRLEPRYWTALMLLSQWQEERGDFAGALRSQEAAMVIYPMLNGGAQRVRELRRRALGDDA